MLILSAGSIPHSVRSPRMLRMSSLSTSNLALTSAFLRASVTSGYGASTRSPVYSLFVITFCEPAFLRFSMISASGSFDQISSVTNGMYGCMRRRDSSSTLRRTETARSFSFSSPFLNESFVASTYQSQRSFQKYS